MAGVLQKLSGGDLRSIGRANEVAKEAKKLSEQGFEFMCEIEGEQLFRKVK